MRTAWRTHSSLITGSMPGIAASTSETCAFGPPPKAVEAPENSLAFAVTWACTSMPMTTSQSPVAPLISFDFFAGASMARAPSASGHELIPRRAWGNPGRGGMPNRASSIAHLLLRTAHPLAQTGAAAGYCAHRLAVTASPPKS